MKYDPTTYNNRTNRQEKLEWLYETCSEDFIKNHLVIEMVTWMGEDSFTEFFNHLCRNWEIKNPDELDEMMNNNEAEACCL